MTKRVGIYAWGGPGTIRLLKTKYHSPKIDTESFYRLYELEYLRKAQELFGITDAWITFSWGFSDATEQEDYQFLRDKLPNFQELGIKTHAYVQGLNVVTKDFDTEDLFCLDPWGNRLSYSKGRSFICPNNPNTVTLLTARVERACVEDVDGIYVDNILFGIPPFAVFSDFLPFFGCSCSHCQEQFQTQFGYALPLTEKKGQQVSDYLGFRATSTQKLIERLSRITHANQKQFGINLYDPTLRLDTLYYGYKLKLIEPFIDYLLIENHSLPSKKNSGNTHVHSLIQAAKRPVFVVSYKNGIGSEPQFSQADIDAIFTESEALGYNPCLKVTEFTTHGIWHTLDLSLLQRPSSTVVVSKASPKTPLVRASNSVQRRSIRLAQKPLLMLLNQSQENKYLALLAKKSGVYSRQVRKARPVLL